MHLVCLVYITRYVGWCGSWWQQWELVDESKWVHSMGLCKLLIEWGIATSRYGSTDYFYKIAQTIEFVFYFTIHWQTWHWRAGLARSRSLLSKPTISWSSWFSLSIFVNHLGFLNFVNLAGSFTIWWSRLAERKIPKIFCMFCAI